MIRTRLRYHRPDSPAEASEILAQHAGDVAVLGGGTQLLPLMHRDEIQVGHVVDLRGLGLTGIDVRNDSIEIGARVTYADVLGSAPLRTSAPLLGRVAAGITGGRQIVQQATLVGSACFNTPGTDMPGVFVALQARLRLHGPAGIREVAAADFFRGASAVDLRGGEFVSSFVIARQTAVGYCKVKHSTGSWPIATASAVRDGSGTLAITLGAVQAVPLHILIDDPGRIETQVREAVTKPWSDVLAPGRYRAAIATVVARRALADLQEYA